MRRRDIENSVLNIRNAFDESRIIHLFAQLSDPRSNPDIIKILGTYQKFSVHYEKFSQIERQILEIFHLKSLDEVSFWSNIVQPESDEGYYTIVNATMDNINLLYDFLPKVLELFKQDYLDLLSEEEAERPIDFRNKEILTIILPESGDHFSKPLRLSEIINGVIQLYQACAILNNESPDDLVVLAIDSGSDKSFDFLGAASVMQCVKETIFEIWDRIVFNKYKVEAEKQQLISNGLSILVSINNSEKEKNISPEQAELLRRGIIGGAEKFIQTGAITPELDSRSYNNPRQLMAPETKMLVEKTPFTQAEEEANPAPVKPATSDTEFSADDLALFKEFMKHKGKMDSGDSSISKGEFDDDNPFK